MPTPITIPVAWPAQEPTLLLNNKATVYRRLDLDDGTRTAEAMEATFRRLRGAMEVPKLPGGLYAAADIDRLVIHAREKAAHAARKKRRKTMPSAEVSHHAGNGHE